MTSVKSTYYMTPLVGPWNSIKHVILTLLYYYYLINSWYLNSLYFTFGMQGNLERAENPQTINDLLFQRIRNENSQWAQRETWLYFFSKLETQRECLYWQKVLISFVQTLHSRLVDCCHCCPSLPQENAATCDRWGSGLLFCNSKPIVRMCS